MSETLRTLSSRLVRRDDSGATATEYAILVGFMAFVIVAGVTIFGNSLSGTFTSLSGVIGTFTSN